MRPEQLGDAPGLGETTLGPVRSVTIEDLGDAPEAGILHKMLQQRLKKFRRLFFALLAEVVDFQIGFDKRPH